MSPGLAPAFLVLKSAVADRAALAKWSEAIEAAHGTVLAAATQDEVEVLEPGTRHTALLIARFAYAPDLERFWDGAADMASGLPDEAQVLAVPGMPFEGWPGHDIPTIATVDVPASEAPRGYMLIEGTPGDQTKEDQKRMDMYRDIIMPMLRERGGYYMAFEFGAGIRVLRGVWTVAFLAISRWPDIARAHDFWFSERYQKVAIPTRTGAGRFDVQLMAGRAG